MMSGHTLATDDEERAALTLSPPPGESVSVVDYITVGTQCQEYVRKVFDAAVRETRGNKVLHLKDTQLTNFRVEKTKKHPHLT